MAFTNISGSGFASKEAESAPNIVSQQRVRYSTMDPVAGAIESNLLARSDEYAIPKGGLPGQDYLDKNIPVLNDRFAMGSVRLASLPNAVPDEARESPFARSRHQKANNSTSRPAW